MNEEPVELTTMCMICDGEGRVVVQKRPAPKWPGMAFPGGHVEPHESITGSVIREVREETGLEVSGLKLCAVRQFFNNEGNRYMVFLYRTDRYTGTLRGSEEGEVFWFPLSGLTEENTAHGFMQALAVYLDESVQEQFFGEEGEVLYRA